MYLWLRDRLGGKESARRNTARLDSARMTSRCAAKVINVGRLLASVLIHCSANSRIDEGTQARMSVKKFKKKKKEKEKTGKIDQ